MKKLIMRCSSLLLLLVGGLHMNPIVYGNVHQEQLDLLVLVEKQFRAENNYQTQCRIDGNNVTMAEMLYAMSYREGAFDPSKPAHYTNNVGSLSAPMKIKQHTKTACIDVGCNRPYYSTKYDGYYELARYLAYYKTSRTGAYDCQISAEKLRTYVGTYKPARLADMVYKAQKYRKMVDQGELMVNPPSIPSHSSAPVQKTVVQQVMSIFDRAQQKQDKIDSIEKQLQTLKPEAKQLWRECIDSGECTK